MLDQKETEAIVEAWLSQVGAASYGAGIRDWRYQQERGHSLHEAEKRVNDLNPNPDFMKAAREARSACCICGLQGQALEHWQKVAADTKKTLVNSLVSSKV